MPTPNPFEGRTVDSIVVFGRCLLAVRLQAQLQQAALAADLRISAQALGQIESGATAPTFRLLLDLGERLKEAGITDHAGVLLELSDYVCRELRVRGVDVVNGTLLEQEVPLALPVLDRLVARMYDDHPPKYEMIPVKVLTMRRKERG